MCPAKLAKSFLEVLKNSEDLSIQRKLELLPEADMATARLVRMAERNWSGQKRGVSGKREPVDE